MYLNTIQNAPGSTKQKCRVGRGIGSGIGKTCGKGHKGQKARSGGTVRRGFEGGQMPFQLRQPKFGFHSAQKLVRAEIRLHELAKVEADIIDMLALKQANLIGPQIEKVKIFLSGTIEKAVTIKGILVTKGARAAIEAAGGKVE